MPSSSQQDSSDDSPESPFEGSPSSSWEGTFHVDPSVSTTNPWIFPSSEPSETVELYRTVSWTPLAIALLALAQLWLVSGAPLAQGVVVALSVSAFVAALVSSVRRSRAEQEEDLEADG